MKKYGIYTAIGYDIPLDERLAVIKASGFNAVCLNFEEGLLKTETAWENQLRLAQKYSLPVEAVHLTGDNMSALWDGTDCAEAVTKRLKEELRRLGALAVPVGVAHVTWGLKPPTAPTKKSLEYFYRITEVAEKYGVKIAFENSVSGEHVRYVLDNIKSKNVGFCYDSGHENAFTPNENFVDLYGERLFAMHLHDNDGKSDGHLLPFEGTIDWQKRVQSLKNTELFKQSVILEVEQRQMPIEEFLKKAYKVAVKLGEM